MTEAHAINAFKPDAVQVIDGETWLMIYNDGTYGSYKAMPKAVTYNGKMFAKMGWNSDTHSVSYKESSLCIPVK